MIPGSNLLNQAFGLIRKQTVGYLRFAGETVNELGYQIPTYDPRVEIQGSFQPIPRRLYQVYGLEMQKRYANFYAPNNILDITRGGSGDIIEYDGRRWQCQSDTDWFKQDGWVGVQVVDIGPVPVEP